MKDERLYAKFTLDFPDHPKILTLSVEAKWALVEMTIYSYRAQSDGRVDVSEYPWDAIEELLGAGLLTVDGKIWELTGMDEFSVRCAPHRPAIPIDVRRAVMERDGYACRSCGAIEDLSLDHIIRFRDGGSDTAENLRVLCMPCNRSRR